MFLQVIGTWKLKINLNPLSEEDEDLLHFNCIVCICVLNAHAAYGHAEPKIRSTSKSWMHVCIS